MIYCDITIKVLSLGVSFRHPTNLSLPQQAVVLLQKHLTKTPGNQRHTSRALLATIAKETGTLGRR